MNDNDKNTVTTKSNLDAIILYALAIAAALGFNDLIVTILEKFSNKGMDRVWSKVIYVVLMFSAALSFAYFTKSSVPV